MKQRMKDFRQWVKEHKGLLAVAGISVTVLVALVLCARNKDEIDYILSLLKKTVKNAPDEDVVGSVSINQGQRVQRCADRQPAQVQSGIHQQHRQLVRAESPGLCGH